MQENTGSASGQLISYGIEIGFLISGFFGALLMVSKSASQRLGATVASLLAGTACANYMTPVIINFLPESVQGRGKYAVAFAMGFMGLRGLEMVIERFLSGGRKKASMLRKKGSKKIGKKGAGKGNSRKARKG